MKNSVGVQKPKVIVNDVQTFPYSFVRGKDTYQVFGSLSLAPVGITRQEDKIKYLLEKYVEEKTGPDSGCKTKKGAINNLHDKIANLKNYEAIVKRFHEKIANGGKFIIWGDYDADGICSSAMFADFLDLIGLKGRYVVHLPDREIDGYGLREENMDKLLEYSFGEDGWENVVCLDNGVNQIGVRDRVEEAGGSFMVIDHHTESSELIGMGVDQTTFQVNPHLKENFGTLEIEGNMCTGELVFGFALGYIRRYCPELEASFVEKDADLLVMTTIGDMMPLRGVNRDIVKFFKNDVVYYPRATMKLLVDTEKDGPGFQISNDGEASNAETFIAWSIVPKINALGRIENPMNAFNYIRGEGGIGTDYIIEVNNIRKVLSKTAKEEMVARYFEDIFSEKRTFVYSGEGGIITKPGMKSLIAGFISGTYCKVSAIGLADGGSIHYSMRSFGGIDLLELVSKKYKFKGHREAGVVSVPIHEKDEFSKFLEDEVSSIAVEKNIGIFCRLRGCDLTTTTVDTVMSSGPYGQGVEYPNFLLVGNPEILRTTNTFSKKTASGNQSFPFSVDGKIITVYNYGEAIPEAELKVTRGIVGELRHPYSKRNPQPVFILKSHIV